MLWTKEKLGKRIEELAAYRYRDALPIASFRTLNDEAGAVGERPPLDGDWGVLRQGGQWTGRDRYLWLTAEIEIPQQWIGRKVLGHFDFGRTGGGNNSGFESLLYLDGIPYQGVDGNHQEVFFEADAAGRKLSLAFRLWSGLEGGGPQKEQTHRIQKAEIAWLDEQADDLYFTSKALLDTIAVLPEDHDERFALLNALDRTFRMLDWSQKGSDAFYASVYEAAGHIRAALAAMKKRHAVTVRCIGHTHIDVAWLWRLKHTREKAARSFSTVLRLMDQFPEYVFLQTQPQLYEYIKEDYPQIYAQIKEKIREGRWEADGGMWLEADCNLTSGESLVRQILYGTRFFREEFGVECTYLWLPDVFGYSWALPQILKKSGISSFMTTKISWNQYNRMPHDSFMWRGLDGSEVLTHFITTPEPGNAAKWWYTYNGKITAETVHGIWKAYRDKEVNQNLLLSYGYGDGGGGVNREMLEMRRRLDEIPGLPQVTTGRANEYFAELQETISAADRYVHTWDGELYLEYHRGTYTSQAYNKKMNRTLELLYRESEWLNVLGHLYAGSWENDAQEALTSGWKIILRNQFHDIIPGSSIREVYEDSKLEYEQAQALAEQVKRESFRRLVTAEDGLMDFAVFNSASWQRTDLLVIPEKSAKAQGSWSSADGSGLAAQKSGDHWIVEVKGLPPMGYATIRFSEDAAAARQHVPVPFGYHQAGIETPFYSIRWNENGQLTRIFDRSAEREVLTEGESGNVLQVFEDKPLQFDAWDIDIFYQEKMREVAELQSLELVESGALRAVVGLKWKYMNSTVNQRMIVYAYNRRIDFETAVDWHERQQLLKVAFPLNIRSTEATYDIQFGNVKRPTHWNTSWDYARFETVGQQWADLSEYGYGVSLLNNCKYGYDIKHNVMRLSLIKSAIQPDTEADQGMHRFTYALYPHENDWRAAHTAREAWQLNNPLTFAAGKAREQSFSLFRVNQPHVMIDAVKKAEDEDKVLVRLHEFAGSRVRAEMTSDAAISAWQECDLLERPEGERQNGAVIAFEIKPYEIKTFLVDLALDPN